MVSSRCAERGPLSSCGGGLLIKVASLVAEHEFLAATHRLSSPGSKPVARGLSRSAACGIFLDQGPNLCLLHWQAPALSHQGSLNFFLFKKSLLLLGPTVQPMGLAPQTRDRTCALRIVSVAS